MAVVRSDSGDGLSLSDGLFVTRVKSLKNLKNRPDSVAFWHLSRYTSKRQNYRSYETDEIEKVRNDPSRIGYLISHVLLEGRGGETCGL